MFGCSVAVTALGLVGAVLYGRREPFGNVAIRPALERPRGGTV